MKFRKQKKIAQSNADKVFEKVDNATVKAKGKAKESFKHFFYVMSRPFVHFWQHSFLIQLIWHLTWLITVIYMGQVTVAEYETNIYNATAFLTGKNKGYIALHYTNIHHSDDIDRIGAILENFKIDYDVMGLSYYSFWNGSA